MHEQYILQFHHIGVTDVARVGSKGANLGEMMRLGIPVPPGFIVTMQAYSAYIDACDLRPQIYDILKNLDINNNQLLDEVSENIKNMIMSSEIPKDITAQIKNAYRELSHGNPIPVAIRSSATVEDLLDASFAGQQASFLNVLGEDSVVENIKKCWASLFESRAIFYRVEKNIDHFNIGIAVPVQKMVVSEVSGVMFSIDPVSNDRNKIVIEAVYGLGEYIVLGAVTPDHYEIDKATLEITKKQVVHQTHKLVRALDGESAHNEDMEVDAAHGSQQKLSDDQILQLARFSKKLEDHYQHAQDSEWAMEQSTVYLVQTRPVTTQFTYV